MYNNAFYGESFTHSWVFYITFYFLSIYTYIENVLDQHEANKKNQHAGPDGLQGR